MKYKWKVGDYLYFDDEKTYKLICQIIKMEEYYTYQTIIEYSYYNNQYTFYPDINIFEVNSITDRYSILITESEVNELKAKVL